jgi:peroxiredoxin
MYPFKKIRRMCLLILLFGTVLLVCPSGCGKKKEAESETATTSNRSEEKKDYESTALQQQQTEQSQQTVLKMADLLKDAIQWRLLAKTWYGKSVDDFVLTDINGQEHRLSDYRGKDVIVLSWAVWCPGSRSQVEILDEVRKQIGEDKLVILGVCNNTNTGRDSLEMVKEYAAKHKIGFPVFYVDEDALAAPFNSNLFVPASYFVDSRGNLKLAVEDIVSIKYVRKILQARR